jgi:LysR family transcriptional activator of glutamate synthase operon
MELQKLNYFLAIVKYDKFTTAANELFISQSSLSKQILSLERELGVKLFNRNTRNIELTPIGEQLVPCAQRIVSESEKISLLINEFKKVQKERILIGAIPVLSYYGITDIIAAYEKQYQNIKIEITETDTTSIFEMLNESKIDIGIVRTDESQHICFDVMPICDDELVLLVGRRHHLADRRIVSLEETAEDEFLFFNTDSFLLKYFEKLFKHAGIFPKVQYSNMRLISIFSFIKQNKVVTFIMKRLAESYRDSMLRIVPLTNHPTLSLSLVTRKNDVSQFGGDFIKYLMNCKTKQKNC